MARAQVLLRDAVLTDAQELAQLWSDLMRRPVSGGPVDDMAVIVEATLDDPDDRIVVAECDGVLTGAVYLRVTTLSPINLEPVVQAISPQVTPDFRHRGIGRSLMEAAVTFAEERGIGHVAGASLSNSREGHRFLARMALAPQAVLRVAPTQLVRSKLTARRRPGSVDQRQPLGQVLAKRRSLRRQRDPA